jgi:hypothetical protein
MTFIKYTFLYALINYHHFLISCLQSDNVNNANQIIFFDIDSTDDLIIKDIYFKQYDDNFNLIIDTMGFISGLFLSKKLRYDYIDGDTFSPMNSYRTFEGHKAELNLINTQEKNNYFPIAIFKVYNKINFYNKSKKYNGIIGLALNYTEDILLDERYFFGEPKQYSIMNFIKNDLKLINKNILSIYKNKLILGDIFAINTKKKDNKNYNNENYINYCKCGDNIFDSFIFFFGTVTYKLL